MCQPFVLFLGNNILSVVFVVSCESLSTRQRHLPVSSS